MSMIEQLTYLSKFFNTATKDNRIGATHISLYMALFQFWHLNHFENPISFTRQEVMPLAKINGRATYHKCINELHEYGYIKYVPSYNPVLKSIVYFVDSNDADHK